MKIKSNSKAFFDYEIIKKYEAGIVLLGWEVKSVRTGNFSFTNSFVTVIRNEAWLRGLSIGSWPGARMNEQDRTRDRKLLLERTEIDKIATLIKENRRYTVVPLEFYTKEKLIKVTIGVARGKRKYEKKEQKKREDLTKQISRDLKDI